MSKQPTHEEWRTIHEAVRTAIETSAEELVQHESRYSRMLYSDYGCPEIDEEIRSRGLDFRTLIFGPQKAGTQFEVNDQKWRVLAKDGYGKNWEPIKSEKQS